MRPRPAPAAAALALLALSVLAASAEEAFDYVRVLEPAPKGTGIWTGRFAPNPGEGPLVGLAVVADWWDGPGDPRVGDPKRTAAEGIVFEVRKGEGAWTALPPANRDLRLFARSAAPADAKDLLGSGADGEWSVRQKAGGSYPPRLRVEFTLRGDPLLVKDLRVSSLMLPGLDPKPVVGHDYIPDRMENPTLKGGAEIHAAVTVENCGARKTREVDLDLLAVPYGKRQGKRLAFAQVPPLEPGKTADLKLDAKIPEDLATEAGVYEVLALVNPRSSEREVEAFNNALGRAFRFEPPPKKDMPEDLKDR
jgi:hypothetical protein